MNARRTFAAAVATLGMALATAPAFAEKPAAVGWWWAGRPTAVVPAVFAPVPTVPEGGMYVAGSASGPSGISALRFEIDPGTPTTTLTLTIAEVIGTPAVDACAAAGSWAPAANGGWDVRAEADCTKASASGTVTGDNIVFALDSLADQYGLVEVVLVPGMDQSSGQPANFSAAFEAPSNDALAVVEPAEADNEPAVASSPREKASVEEPPLSGPEPLSMDEPVTSFDLRAEEALPEAVAEPSVQNFGGSAQGAPIATSFPSEGFAYPAVLVLPLLFVVVGSYVAWALSRPVVLGRVPSR